MLVGIYSGRKSKISESSLRCVKNDKVNEIVSELCKASSLVTTAPEYWDGVHTKSPCFMGEKPYKLYRKKNGVKKCFDSLKKKSLSEATSHSFPGGVGRTFFIEFISPVLYLAISKGGV